MVAQVYLSIYSMHICNSMATKLHSCNFIVLYTWHWCCFLTSPRKVLNLKDFFYFCLYIYCIWWTHQYFCHYLRKTHGRWALPNHFRQYLLGMTKKVLNKSCHCIKIVKFCLSFFLLIFLRQFRRYFCRQHFFFFVIFDLSWIQWHDVVGHRWKSRIRKRMTKKKMERQKLNEIVNQHLYWWEFKFFEKETKEKTILKCVSYSKQRA